MIISLLSLITVKVVLLSKNRFGLNRSPSLSQLSPLINNILSPVSKPASFPNSNAKIPFLFISSLERNVSPLLKVIIENIMRPVITLKIMPPNITTSLCHAGFDLNSQDSGSLLI